MSIWQCEVCGKEFTHEGDGAHDGIMASFEHFRLMHPDIDVQTWADGGPVILDASPSPEDFKP